MKRDSLIEVYINIISPGFTKTVSGTMTLDMNPLQSTSKIFIDKQILMNTRCSYKGSRVCVATDMLPYKKRTSDTLKFTRQVLDFSQAPSSAANIAVGKRRTVRIYFIKSSNEHVRSSDNTGDRKRTLPEDGLL